MVPVSVTTFFDLNPVQFDINNLLASSLNLQKQKDFHDGNLAVQL
jgi:hypothetical protein